MIIDMHTHIGTFYGMTKITMPEKMLLESMDKYGIDYAIVSNGSGCEFDSNLKPLADDRGVSQTDINEESIKFAKENSKKIGVLLWAKPHTEGVDKPFEQMIVNNPGLVLGIKVHPFHSQIKFNAPEVCKYIDLADKYNLPVLVHTAWDETSNPKLVDEMASKYSNVKFIMAHMGLGTDNEEAIQLISKKSNLFGDTAWVPFEKVQRAISICGVDKILFGTDNPINGLDTYNDNDFYNRYFCELKQSLSCEDWDCFVYKNACRVFNINQ